MVPLIVAPCFSDGEVVGGEPHNTTSHMILELRHRPTGLGYQRQRWPRAVHHIMRFGRSEARLIVEDGEQPTVRQVMGFLIAAILTNP